VSAAEVGRQNDPPVGIEAFLQGRREAARDDRVPTRPTGHHHHATFREFVAFLASVDLGPSTVRYPDVLVDVSGEPFGDLTATAPILVAEVISPSSASDDLAEKPQEYFGLPSLSVYLVLAQDEAKAWVWIRGSVGFPLEPDVLRGTGEVIRLTPLGIELPLSEIYSHNMS
jgi:Uma2 family endonuclease